MCFEDCVLKINRIKNTINSRAKRKIVFKMHFEKIAHISCQMKDILSGFYLSKVL